MIASEPYRDHNSEPCAWPKVVIDVHIERLWRRALCPPVLDVDSTDLHGGNLHRSNSVSVKQMSEYDSQHVCPVHAESSTPLPTHSYRYQYWALYFLVPAKMIYPDTQR